MTQYSAKVGHIVLDQGLIEWAVPSV